MNWRVPLVVLVAATASCSADDATGTVPQTYDAGKDISVESPAEADS